VEKGNPSTPKVRSMRVTNLHLPQHTMACEKESKSSIQWPCISQVYQCHICQTPMHVNFRVIWQACYALHHIIWPSGLTLTKVFLTSWSRTYQCRLLHPPTRACGISGVWSTCITRRHPASYGGNLIKEWYNIYYTRNSKIMWSRNNMYTLSHIKGSFENVQVI
jgi:hypothetical protein